MPKDINQRLLITTGGGGDGEALIDWVLSCYERHFAHLLPALIVTGPFMRGDARHDFERRIAAIPKLQSLTFEPRMEHLMAECAAVVSMGGYNTFCEILSFDKKALLVPRHAPRLEQTIRADAAARLGLASRLAEPDRIETPDIDRMTKALTLLPVQPAPSSQAKPGLLDGLQNVVSLCEQWLAPGEGPLGS